MFHGTSKLVIVVPGVQVVEMVCLFFSTLSLGLWRLTIYHYGHNETFNPISMKNLFAILVLYNF